MVRLILVAVPAFLPFVAFGVAPSDDSFGPIASLLAAGGATAPSASVASPNVGAAALRGRPLSVTGTGVESASSFSVISDNNAVDLGLVAARPRFLFGCERRHISL